jgi:hypothetical protein
MADSAAPLSAVFKQPWQTQLDYFQQKLNLPTEQWTDIMKAQHDRSFVVAGAMASDLLEDLRQAVGKAIGAAARWPTSGATLTRSWPRMAGTSRAAATGAPASSTRPICRPAMPLAATSN